LYLRGAAPTNLLVQKVLFGFSTLESRTAQWQVDCEKKNAYSKVDKLLRLPARMDIDSPGFCVSFFVNLLD